MKAQRPNHILNWRPWTRAMLVVFGTCTIGWIALSIPWKTHSAPVQRDLSAEITSATYVHPPTWSVWIAVVGCACVLVLFWNASDPRRRADVTTSDAAPHTASPPESRAPTAKTTAARPMIDLDPAVADTALSMLQQLPVGGLLLTQGGDITYANAFAREFLWSGAPAKPRESMRSAARDLALVDAMETARIRGANADPVECRVTTADGPANIRVRYLQAASTDHAAAFSLERVPVGPHPAQTLAHVVHELRSPLTSIRAHAETLLSEQFAADAERKSSAEVILMETVRLERMVASLLSIAEIEAGATHINRLPIRIEDTIKPVVAELSPLARIKGVTITTTVCDRPACVLGDEQRLRQIWTNLVDNAIKYTPAGGKIDVSIEVETDNVCVCVADTGIGIEPRFHKQIFEKFYRVDDPSVLTQVGTGLGMPIVKELVRLHGGTISLQSKLGEGATFRVCLPYKPVPGAKKHTEVAWRAC